MAHRSHDALCGYVKRDSLFLRAVVIKCQVKGGWDVSGSNYIVLGASGGIGSETCRQLRAAGSNVLLAGRNEERLAILGSELDCGHRVVDATSLEQVAECFAEANEQLGRIDGILNCVGSVLLKPAHTTSADEWHSTISTNLTSAFATGRAGYKTLRANGGAIILL